MTVFHLDSFNFKKTGNVNHFDELVLRWKSKNSTLGSVFDSIYLKFEWSISWSNSHSAVKSFDNRKKSVRWFDHDEASRYFLKTKIVPGEDYNDSPVICYYRFLEPNQSITTEIYSQELNGINIQLTIMRPAFVNRQFCFTAMPGYMVPEWHCRISSIWDTSFAIFLWPLAHWLSIFQASW